MNSVPKFIAFRDKRILRLAKDQPCQHCFTSGTTVAAHSNASEDGKGVGLKSSDLFIAYLCNDCHNNYDRKLRHPVTKELLFSQQDFHKSMKRTQSIWLPILLEGKRPKEPTILSGTCCGFWQ